MLQAAVVVTHAHLAQLAAAAAGGAAAPSDLRCRLVQLRAYIEKIRPIDKQLAYQIDKLLRATSVAQAQAAADAGAAEEEAPAAAAGRGGAAAGGDEDALHYRPNPQALIAKAPLVGDAAGE